MFPRSENSRITVVVTEPDSFGSVGSSIMRALGFRAAATTVKQRNTDGADRVFNGTSYIRDKEIVYVTQSFEHAALVAARTNPETVVIGSPESEASKKLFAESAKQTFLNHLRLLTSKPKVVETQQDETAISTLVTQAMTNRPGALDINRQFVFAT